MVDDFLASSAEFDREPLSMMVARRIRATIISGELKNGTALPSEKELCAKLNVGRSTVREALRILQAQGLVTGGNSVSTRGPTVDGRKTVSSAASALENVLLLGELSVDELLSVRLIVEDAALRAAGHHRDPDALAKAERALEDMRSYDHDPQRFGAADIAFHVALVEASGNRAFTLVTQVLKAAMAFHLGNALKNRPKPHQTLKTLIQEHTAIFEAVRLGHGRKAAQLARAHVVDFYEVEPSV